MKYVFSLVLVSCLMLMGGCSTPAHFQNMTYTQPLDNSFDTKLSEQVEIVAVQGGTKTNPLWVSQISNEDFQKALEISLSSQGLLADNGQFNLKVTLLEVKQPMFGINLQVSTQVNYTIVDTNKGEIVFNQVIDAAHTATFSDSLVAATRLKMANEGAGKNNIKTFLERLSNLSINSSELSLER